MKWFFLVAIAVLISCNEKTSPQQNWALLNGTDTLDGRAFIINSSDVLFVGTFDKGILRSTDGGLHWIRSDSGFVGDPDVRCFGIDSSGHILAGSYDYLFKSTDNGFSWSIISTAAEKSESYISAIGVSPQGDYFYARNRGGLYRSTDQGASWDSLRVADGTQSIVFASDGSIYTGTQYCGYMMRSSDEGTSWSMLIQSCVEVMVVDHQNGIYAGTDEEGLLKSSDYGVNWFRIDYDVAADSALNWGIVFGLLVDKHDRLFAVSDAKGEVFISTDNGASWTSLGNGLPVGNISRRVAMDTKGFLYVKTDGMGIYKSTFTTTE